MGGMMSQNILNLVDIGMVGHLGDTALAATGIGSFTNYLAIRSLLACRPVCRRLLPDGLERSGMTKPLCH